MYLIWSLIEITYTEIWSLVEFTYVVIWSTVKITYIVTWSWHMVTADLINDKDHFYCNSVTGSNHF